MVCNLYEMEVGEYIKDALIESLKEEITDGEFCELLASKLDENKNDTKRETPNKSISEGLGGIGNYNFVE